MTREDRLATAVVELTRTLVDEFDVLDFLQRVTERTSQVFSGATALIFLADQRGSLQLVGISPPARNLARLLQVAEGPAMQTHRGRVPLARVPLDRHGPWPAEAGVAHDLGLGHVQGTPLHIVDDQVGVLLLVGGTSDTAQSPAEDGTDLLEALGGLATVGLLRQRSPRERELLAEQMQAALTMRIVVEQASGMVAEVENVSVDVAFAMMEEHARSTRRPLTAVAQQVVVDRGRLGTAQDRAPASDD